MQGVNVPHVTQFPLGFCAAHISGGKGFVEAICVVGGHHLCQTCTVNHYQQMGTVASALTAFVNTVKALP